MPDDYEWHESGNGWAVTFGDGVSATILKTRKGSIRWNIMLTGKCDTIAEAHREIGARMRALGIVDEVEAAA